MNTGHGAYGDRAQPRVGFFTDTSVCIGCKACEVACKEWNQVPASPNGFTGDSYDNTLDLGANTWRHVAFVEQRKDLDLVGAALADESGLQTYQDGDGMRWLMASDVCKHCTHAACLDVCPTGALIRTARAAIEARVMVTDRLAPLALDGHTVHQVGLPYHWGANGLVTGDAANELLSQVLDLNTHIAEYKSLTCDVRPGRRPR